ncbi:MAG: metal-dependent hydrolase [Methanomicrobiales archaeon]|nr:metal-dependent hydrolase [Methanomicrobiales archaeon]
MLILSHVFAGMVLGISVSYLLRIRPAVGVAVLGALLPDLLDKPLALFIFPGPTSIGQTFGHTLLFCLIILAAALIVSRGYHTGLALLLPAGVLLHQVMDLAWLDPVTWVYPALGPLLPCACGGAGYVAVKSLAEVSSVSEWIFLLVIILLAALIFHERIATWTGHDPASPGRRLFPAAIVLLVLLGLAAGFSGALDLPTPLEAGEMSLSEDLMLSIVSLIGAVILYEKRDRILNPI